MKYVIIFLVCVLSIIIKEVMKSWLGSDGDFFAPDFMTGWVCAQLWKDLD